MKNFFFKKLLVISDNLLQCQRLHSLIRKLGTDKAVTIDWACSPFSSPSEFNAVTGLSFNAIDLKIAANFERIIQNYDLVISMHCKQLFPPRLVSQVKCINIHPGYNPVNRGWYPQVFSIINHTSIGATIHEIDEELDHGNIIDRMEVPQFVYDTSKEIYDRVLSAEIELVERNLENILMNRYSAFAPEEEGRLYLKKDFNALCELDLAEEGSFSDFIDRLRALTHTPYRNAYFIDRTTGNKIFINIDLQPENQQLRNE